MSNVHRRTALALLLLAAPLLVLPALARAGETRSWDYKSYKKDRYGQYSKDNYDTAAIRIEESGGAWTFTMIAPRLDVCYRSPLPAVVEKTEATTTITVSQPVQGCDVFRYIIRNDGSGGTKETMRGDQWRSDTYDHGLTPSK